MSSSESEESRGTSVSVATVAETTPAGPSTLFSPPRAVDKAAAPVADAATGSTGGSVHARSKRRKPVYDLEIPGLPGEGGWMARKVDESENPWPIYATVMKYVGITKVCVTDSRQTKHAFVCLLCQKTDTEEERVFKCDRTSAGNIRRHMAAHKDDPDWLAVADRPSRAIKAAQEAAAAASECEGSTPGDKRKWKQITIQDTFLGPKRKKSASDVTQVMRDAAITEFFEVFNPLRQCLKSCVREAYEGRPTKQNSIVEDHDDAPFWKSVRCDEKGLNRVSEGHRLCSYNDRPLDGAQSVSKQCNRPSVGHVLLMCVFSVIV